MSSLWTNLNTRTIDKSVHNQVGQDVNTASNHHHKNNYDHREPIRIIDSESSEYKYNLHIELVHLKYFI